MFDNSQPSMRLMKGINHQKYKMSSNHRHRIDQVSNLKKSEFTQVTQTKNLYKFGPLIAQGKGSQVRFVFPRKGEMAK